jgi:hypothetical protein
MKNLTIAFLAAVSLMSFAGCKKKGGSDGLAKMTEFKDQMCKCADKECADKVTEAMTQWGKDMAKEGGDKEAAKMSEEDMKKSAAVSEEMGKCMAKLMTPAMPAPAGDMPAAPAAPAGDMPAAPAAPAGDMPAAPAAPTGDMPAAPAAPAGDKPAAPPN